MMFFLRIGIPVQVLQTVATACALNTEANMEFMANYQAKFTIYNHVEGHPDVFFQWYTYM